MTGQQLMLILAASLASFACTAGVLVLLLRSGARNALLDAPNERSLHVRPVPRIGGLGIMAGLLAAALVLRSAHPVIVIALGLSALSLIDDWRSLSPALRFLAHCLAAILAVTLLIPTLTWGAAVLVVVGIVWMTNLYNFMDGADGLAGGMAAFGFGAYLVAAWLAGEFALASWSAVLVAGALGFLCFNFPPAKLFLGDGGSVPLGFLAAAVGILGWNAGCWPMWFPIVAFSPFVVDATVTLLRRLARGEAVWRAHRSHYYQRLVLTGWGHRKLAVMEYALMLISASVAVIGARAGASAQLGIIAVLCLLYLLIGVSVDTRWRRARSAALLKT